MFTGIIKNLGRIDKIEKNEDIYSIRINAKDALIKAIKISDSVAINGICLTVVRVNKRSFLVEAITETINLTTISYWTESMEVNLELAMSISDRLEGHIVQGHIDGIARLKSMIKVGGSWVFRFNSYSDYFKYLVKKGSVTIDGVSLTLIDIEGEDFDVAVIPHTYSNTIIKNYIIGTEVNIETDILGKYVYKMTNLK